MLENGWWMDVNPPKSMKMWYNRIIYIYIYLSGWWFQPTPLKKRLRQLGFLIPTEWKVIKFMFQTTNRSGTFIMLPQIIGNHRTSSHRSVVRSCEMMLDFFQDISENSGTLFREETGDKHRIIDMSFKTHLTNMIRHFFESPGPVPTRFYLL